MMEVTSDGGSPLKIRIGLHLGQVLVEGGLHRDVFGRHVNRAARVMGLASGGQVLMTHPVYDSARGWLEQSHLQWRDHGDYLLKGIPEATRIVEVCDRDIEPRRPRGAPAAKPRRPAWLWGAVGLLLLAACRTVRPPPAALPCPSSPATWASK